MIKLLNKKSNFYDKFKNYYDNILSLEYKRSYQDIRLKQIILYKERNKLDIYTFAFANTKKVIYFAKNVNLNKNLLNKYDEIYLTRDTHNHEYLNTQEGKKLPIPHCIEYSDGWKIIDEVITAVEDKPHKIIDKNTFGSLYLANLLRETYFIEQEDIEIDICGIDTEICVISNAMIIKAAMPESKLCVIEKACAGTNKKFHDNAISAMQMCQIDII